jgi:L-threonylcarbamoyladenylate synthase
VGVFDQEALKDLFALKERDETHTVLWMVRDIDDVKEYAEVSEEAERVMEAFLPGPLTVVLPLKKEVLKKYPFCSQTVGFRVSSDPVAQKTVEEFMEKNNMPLTSTSANISGELPESTVPEILKQFGDKKDMIDTVIDDGDRSGLPSTVIEFKDGKLIIHREGQTSVEAIQEAI